ncbi:MAG: tetratricopeptide repeat protein [Candidatus Rokubacteria bacterium]|nr:tetratricopeptide repeat protein [Candidatus Rokubacteria bacterium]
MKRIGALVLLLAAGAAAAELSREQALRDLAGRDVGARREAAQTLGAMGIMTDAPRLVAALRDPDPLVRATAERSLWLIWGRSGDDEVDLMFQVGLEQMNAQEAVLAVDTFTRIIQRRPDFAEAWNKRATVYYFLGQYQKSLADCDEVMKRNPNHFGALSGYGMIYLQLGEPEKAVTYFERALQANPNLDQVESTLGMLRELVQRRRRNSI